MSLGHLLEKFFLEFFFCRQVVTEQFINIICTQKSAQSRQATLIAVMLHR